MTYWLNVCQERRKDQLQAKIVDKPTVGAEVFLAALDVIGSKTSGRSVWLSKWCCDYCLVGFEEAV